MKPINEMNQIELARHIDATLKQGYVTYYGIGAMSEISLRLRELHELTRWIPVSERLPTEEDGDEHGHVLVSEVERESPNRRYEQVLHWDLVGEDYFYTATHWRRIDKPEGV